MAGLLEVGFGLRREVYPVDRQWVLHSLKGFRPEVLDGVRQFVADLDVHRFGKANASGVCERLNASRNVYCVPEDVSISFLDVSQMDSDSDEQGCSGDPLVAVLKHVLELGGTLGRP